MKLEYTTRYVPSLAQWDVQLLIDRSPKAFGLAGSEHAANETGRDMVRRARENIAAGRSPTDGV